MCDCDSYLTSNKKTCTKSASFFNKQPIGCTSKKKQHFKTIYMLKLHIHCSCNLILSS